MLPNQASFALAQHTIDEAASIQARVRFCRKSLFERKFTVVAYLYRAGDTCAELVHNILCSDKISAVVECERTLGGDKGERVVGCVGV